LIHTYMHLVPKNTSIGDTNVIYNVLMLSLMYLMWTLTFVLMNKEGLVEDVKVGGRLGCSDHEMMNFRILHGGSRAIRRIQTLDFRRTNYGLFKELLGGIPWLRALEGRGVQEWWSLLKHHFLHAQEWCIPVRRISRKAGRRTGWMSKELLSEFRWKRKVHGMWKEGQATWEEYKEFCQSMQGCNEEGQGPPGIEAGKGCQKQQEGLLQLLQ